MLGAGTLEDLTTLDSGKWLERTNKYRHAIEEVPLAEWWYWDTDWPEFAELVGLEDKSIQDLWDEYQDTFY